MPYFLNPPSQLTESRINPDKIEPTQLNLEKDGENAKSLLRGTPMCFSFPWETCRISHSDVVLEAQNLCFSYRFSDFPVTSPVRFVFFAPPEPGSAAHEAAGPHMDGLEVSAMAQLRQGAAGST